jgi:hypothetical protein
MKTSTITASLFCLAMSLVASNAARANSIVKIDALPTEYIPVNSPTNREPLSLAGFHFEVNLETQRARVVADYTYPDFMIYEPNDPTKGPRSTVAQIPGLKYDAATHEVVFESGGTRTVCATVSEQSGIFGRHTKVRNTGACKVVTNITQQTEDDGWSLHHFPVLNAYFEAP